MLYALPLFGKLDKEENKTTRANKNNEISKKYNNKIVCVLVLIAIDSPR